MWLHYLIFYDAVFGNFVWQSYLSENPQISDISQH